jgi:hypothetical protein
LLYFVSSARLTFYLVMEREGRRAEDLVAKPAWAWGFLPERVCDCGWHGALGYVSVENGIDGWWCGEEIRERKSIGVRLVEGLEVQGRGVRKE